MSEANEVRLARADHLAAVRSMFEQLEVFLFTLGLTEAWCAAEDGAELADRLHVQDCLNDSILIGR